MGNFCCACDMKKNTKLEEYHLEINKGISYPKKYPLFLHSHLETVKEEASEYTEQSEYKTVSKASNY